MAKDQRGGLGHEAGTGSLTETFSGRFAVDKQFDGSQFEIGLGRD